MSLLLFRDNLYSGNRKLNWKFSEQFALLVLFTYRFPWFTYLKKEILLEVKSIQ